MKLSQMSEGHWRVATKEPRHSPLLYPSDREKFINWGKPKKKRKKKLSEDASDLYQQLLNLRPAMAQAVQEVYDAWSQDEEGLDEEFGGGGICDRIAESLGYVIAGSLDVELDEYGHDGDDHAALIVSDGHQRYYVDIPPHVYESGGGLSWSKIPDVSIKPTDIIVAEI